MIYGYARVSSGTQVDGCSLDEQERRIRWTADKDGPSTVVMFIDAGVSGTIPLGDRPSGKRLTETAVSGDSVIVTKMDRMFRSALDAAKMLKWFQEKGVRLIVGDLGTDPVTENGTSRMVFGILASVAEWERLRIAERTQEGRHAKLKKGGHIGGRAPYGTRIVGAGVDAKLEVVPAERDMLAKAVELHRTGLGLRAIAERMAAEGMVNRRGGVFDPAQIRRFILYADNPPKMVNPDWQGVG